MSLVEKAKAVALEAHGDQRDKAGKPYIEHLEYVANHVEVDEEKCVAYLHDVLEDTKYPCEKIKEQFGEVIFNAVQAMTKKKGEDYFEFIGRVATNPIAIKVKLADLENNMMLDRLPKVTEKDLERVKKYQKAHEMLEMILRNQS